MNTVDRSTTLLLVFLGFCVGLGSGLLYKEYSESAKVGVTPNLVDIVATGTPELGVGANGHAEAARLASPPLLIPAVPLQQPTNKQPSFAPTITLRYVDEGGVEIAKSNLPTLQILNPKGNENLAIGSTQQIAWMSTNDGAISAVSIHISGYNPACDVGDCSTIGGTVAEHITGTHEYAWEVAETTQGFSMPPGKYTISLRGITNYKIKSYQGETMLGEASYVATAHSEVITVVK